ncbi:RloB family protein [Streptosporangium sp. NPDC049046]|uniref:RloB family protein n=1 Tax=Streptosporangium sp. NPDC049046 TaxID=3155031 RepID=UPI0034432520
MSPQTSKSTKISTETSLKGGKKGFKKERSTFLILCEGKTEKDYFAGMRSRRGPQIDVDVPKGDHLAKVREAVDRASNDYDTVWCVLDTELDGRLTAEMTREAEKSSRVRLGLSTPCFELWLILHHADWARPFQSADAAKKELKKIKPSWSEKNTRFSDFSAGVDAACDRAKKLNPDGGNSLKNPSTSVWELVTGIRESGPSAAKSKILDT